MSREGIRSLRRLRVFFFQVLPFFFFSPRMEILLNQSFNENIFHSHRLNVYPSVIIRPVEGVARLWRGCPWNLLWEQICLLLCMGCCGVIGVDW